VRGIELTKQECSFLKKRTKKLLFPRSFPDRENSRHLSADARHKSLLLLFFRKEDLSSLALLFPLTQARRWFHWPAS
jgi:hypothetical protein